jgi:Uma2 family endonuclease
MQTGLATYPDASVVRGPTVRDPEKKTNVTNPRILVEVTSDGTEDYDRGEKLTHYKQIPTLEAVVVVSHRGPRVEVWSTAARSESWRQSEAGAGGEATIPALGCSLNVNAIWQAAIEPR